MASPIPATAYKGLVRPHATRTPIQEQFMTNQCWGELLRLLGELQVPKRHQIPKSTKKWTGKVRNGRSTGTPIWRLFSDICKVGVLADTPTESSVFWTSLLRFCAGVAEREREYCMVFSVSNAHHTFWEKVGFVMSVDTFRAPVWEPLKMFCVLLGSLFEVLFFTTFEGNRVTAGNSK